MWFIVYKQGLYVGSTVCDATHYGPTCSLECNANCLNNACNNVNGSCKDGCTFGMLGDFCNETCDEHCFSCCNNITENCKSKTVQNENAFFLALMDFLFIHFHDYVSVRL